MVVEEKEKNKIINKEIIIFLLIYNINPLIQPYGRLVLV